MTSKPVRSAQRRSSSSFSERAGTETATPGRLRPLWSEIMPPSMTLVWTRGPSTAVTSRHDLAVVDEDAFAGADVGGEAGVGRAAGLAVAFHALFDGDGEGVAAFKEYGAFGEVAEADLRALKVGEDADAAAGLVGGLADVLVALLVFGVAAVAEVEAGDVHSGVDQCLDLVVRVGGGAQGADDLCSAHVSSLWLTGG